MKNRIGFIFCGKQLWLIATAMFFFQACKQPLPPGEGADRQLAEITYNQPDAGYVFEYDADDRLVAIEGNRPGATRERLEFFYNGDRESVNLWVFTSPDESYLRGRISLMPYYVNSMRLSIEPPLDNMWGQQESFDIYPERNFTFPDSVRWEDGGWEYVTRWLMFDWHAPQHRLNIQQTTSFYAPGGLHENSDTSFVCTMDETENPLKGIPNIYDLKDFLRYLSPFNLTSIEVIWPDTSFFLLQQEFTYDDRGRASGVRYEENGEIVEETWSYRL